MNGLYLSGWNPQGARRDYERCSLINEQAEERFRNRGIPEDWGCPFEAVGWFDKNTGLLKVMVADYPNGRRAIMRNRKSDYSITMTRTPPEHLQ